MASDQWYDCEGYSNSDKRSILAVRYNMAKTGYNNENKYTFAEGISNEMVAIVSETARNARRFGGTYSERKYANGSLATNIVGYIGAIDPDTYEEKRIPAIISWTLKSALRASRRPWRISWWDTGASSWWR